MESAEVLAAVALLAVAVYIVLRQIVAAWGDVELGETNHFATEIIENAGEGIVVYDRDLRYVVWNHFMEELTGLTAEEVLGRKAIDIFPHLREQQVDELIARALGGEPVSAPDAHYYIPGSARRGWVSAVYRPHYDAAGSVTGVIGLIRDITERKQAEQQIEYQAYHHALTGLANRRLCQEHLSLALALAGRHSRLVAVLFLDLDHFKLINDTLGHTTGDDLLKVIAGRLKGCGREGDTVARVGGDEFTIVLQDVLEKEDAAAVAQEVLRAITEPIHLHDHRLFVTTSVGITTFPDDGGDAETMPTNPANAMHRAKADGRNTYRLSTEQLDRSMHERLTLVSGPHLAIERHESAL